MDCRLKLKRLIKAYSPKIIFKKNETKKNKKHNMNTIRNDFLVFEIKKCIKENNKILHEKIDHLIMKQQQELLEIQKVQIDMMNDILTQVNLKKSA